MSITQYALFIRLYTYIAIAVQYANTCINIARCCLGLYHLSPTLFVTSCYFYNTFYVWSW